MFDDATQSSEQSSPSTAKVSRARSLPSARPFRVAIFYCSIHYLGIVVAITALVCVIINQSQEGVKIMIGAIAFSAVTWLLALFKRRWTYCPLCKGTPLVNSGARVHVRAVRLLPLNHGVTAIFSIMATQKFRCMYCGSDYDLLKPRARLIKKAAAISSHND